MKLILPWPPRELSPNARVHWGTLARKKAAYKDACAWTAKSQGAKKLPADRLAVSLVFVPPSRQPRDIDNCLASLKAGLDGIAQVIGVDDSKWTITMRLAADEVGGFVRVHVESEVADVDR